MVLSNILIIIKLFEVVGMFSLVRVRAGVRVKYIIIIIYCNIFTQQKTWELATIPRWHSW